MSHAHDCAQCCGYWVCDDTCGEEPDALRRDCLLAQNKALRHAVHYIYYHTDSHRETEGQMTYGMKERLSNTLASLVDARQERDAAHAALDKSNAAINKYLAERQALVVALNASEGAVAECWNAVDTQGPRATDGSTLPDEIRGLVAEVARLREELKHRATTGEWDRVRTDNARLREERDAAREVQARCEDNCKRRTARMIRAEDERGALQGQFDRAIAQRDAARAVCKEQAEALEELTWVPYDEKLSTVIEGVEASVKALRAALGKDGE